MTGAFEQLQKVLRQLPGLGYRSAERIALHLLVEKPQRLTELVSSLQDCETNVRTCQVCGNLCEEERCSICMNPKRDASQICVVESIPDLVAIERSAAFPGLYQVLHGKLSPIHDIGPEDLNLSSLKERLHEGVIREVLLALSNDIEGEATCHFIQEDIIGDRDIAVTRIGFGIPSGSGVVYADPVTLKSALDGRRTYE